MQGGLAGFLDVGRTGVLDVLEGVLDVLEGVLDVLEGVLDVGTLLDEDAGKERIDFAILAHIFSFVPSVETPHFSARVIISGLLYFSQLAALDAQSGSNLKSPLLIDVAICSQSFSRLTLVSVIPHLAANCAMSDLLYIPPLFLQYFMDSGSFIPQ